jgi:hypothetical protein
MKNADSYKKFQDLIFQEINDREKISRQDALEQFVKIAESRGFTLDRLISMAESGMSGARLWCAVNSK